MAPSLAGGTTPGAGRLPVTVMCEWFNEVGYAADIPALEDRFGFEFTGLEAYLRAAGWADKQGMDSVPGWVKAMA